MLGSALFWALVSLTSVCRAAPVSAVGPAGNKVVRLPLKREAAQNARRDLPVYLANNKVDYVVEVLVGSPAQPITLLLDTGSSETWVFSSSACNNCRGGIFDPSASSTTTSVDDIGVFSQSYFDGTSATGYYITDQVTLGAATISDVYLGVATSSVGTQNRYGIMGIGFDNAETSSVMHPGILDDLINQGVITYPSYSIYLDDIAASSGSIIFGGVDNTKWSGDLVSFPIMPYTDNAPRLQVEWTYLSLTDASGTETVLTASDLSYPVAMDTGYTTTVLPTSIFNQLYSYFGVTGPEQYGNHYVGCQLAEGYLTYGFGAGPAKTIQVPFSELAVPLPSGECLFGLLPQDGAVISFGDSFLRSAYVNFDFGSNTIGLAQAVWT